MSGHEFSLSSRLTSAAVSPASRAAIALLLVLLLGVIFNADGAFFALNTHSSALRLASVNGILACGMTLVIVTGGIDLAVGSVLALVSVTFSLMMLHWGWSAWLAVPISLAVGTACGMVSGGLTAVFRIQPFIATLAMMVFARGLAKMVSGQRKIAWESTDGSGAPALFQAIDSLILHDFLPVVTVVFLACVAVTWLLLARHRWGRHLCAIGGNEEAARLSGVPIRWAKTLAYAACGLTGAMGGMLQAGLETHGDPATGEGFELTAIAIVVIGGTNLMGGRGGIGLTLIGTMTITYLGKILSLNGYQDYSRLMITGVIIVGAVLLQRRRRN